MKKYKETIAFIIVSTVMTLLLAEIFFQVIHANSKNPVIRKTPLKRLVKLTEPPFSWERYFLTNYEKGEMGYIPNLGQDGLHLTHDTRGWVIKPDVSVTRRGATYTSNAQGFRSLYDFENDPERYQVLIVGDSFTFGDGINDEITWPHLLQQLDRDLNVLNMGGSGYGVDQMYITLSETISQYKPKLVIAAFIDNNLHRSMLDFRDYKKPRFDLEDGGLVLRNTPIPGFEEVITELQNKKLDDHSSIQIINVFNYFKRKYRLTDYLPEPEKSDTHSGCGEKCTALNTKLFEEMGRIAAENNAEFLVVYLPYGPEIYGQDILSYGELFFDNYNADHGSYFLNPRKELLSIEGEKSYAHYHETENSIVGNMVYEKIKELPSWKDFKGAGAAAD